MLLAALSLIFPLVMVSAMVTDVRRFEIPNSLPLLLILVFPLTAFSAGLSWQHVLWAFALGALVLLVSMGLFVLRVFGGGDGKLLAATVLWTGQEKLWEFLFITAMAGGVVALVLLIYRRLPLAKILEGSQTMRQLHTKKQEVPYAVAIGCGGLFVYPQLPIWNG